VLDEHPLVGFRAVVYVLAPRGVVRFGLHGVIAVRYPQSGLRTATPRNEIAERRECSANAFDEDSAALWGSLGAIDQGGLVDLLAFVLARRRS
jgi:hypothetical protein